VGAVGRNDPCPCGSGKKYKFCCFQKDYDLSVAKKKKVEFTLEDGSPVKMKVHALDAIPTHNANGLEPDITPHQMMDLCLDELVKILDKEKAGMLVDLVNRVILDMNVIPSFTYHEFSDRMAGDQRFELFNSQICSLRGTNPLELMADKIQSQKRQGN